MRPFLRTRMDAFGYAFSGWWYVLRTQRNAWIHALFSIFAFALSFWLRIPPRDWATIFLATAMVWTAEFINTALEAIVDLHSPEQHPLAKVGKDIGAAAVLIAALTAAIVGLLLLGPPILLKLQGD